MDERAQYDGVGWWLFIVLLVSLAVTMIAWEATTAAGWFPL